MSDPPEASLETRPTAEQIERFSRLSPEERFHWLMDMLALCYELATPEARASWAEHKRRG
jgi:hypothetical protein